MKKFQDDKGHILFFDVDVEKFLHYCYKCNKFKLFNEVLN